MSLEGRRLVSCERGVTIKHPNGKRFEFLRLSVCMEDERGAGETYEMAYARVKNAVCKQLALDILEVRLGRRRQMELDERDRETRELEKIQREYAL